MTNYEFYKEEIEMRYRNTTSFAVTKRGCIIDCKNISCDDCIFSNFNNSQNHWLNCGDRKMMWAVQERVEPPKLTKQERKFCELLEEKDIWFARQRNMTMPTIFIYKPYKTTTCWHGNTIESCELRKHCNARFEFIKWEDEEPWSVAELLKLEVEE
jgi:hypothetical protein